MTNLFFMYAAAVVLFAWTLAYGLLGLTVLRKFREVSEEGMQTMGTLWSLFSIVQLSVVALLLILTRMGEPGSALVFTLNIFLVLWLASMAGFLILDWKRSPGVAFRAMPFVFIVVASLILVGLFA